MGPTFDRVKLEALEQNLRQNEARSFREAGSDHVAEADEGHIDLAVTGDACTNCDRNN